ncbi:MAG TPA: hypothetical protein VJU59_50295 [Paraburkholderia sp.]|uniref:hypothetical protein n=1 Tax=Paraburkholderia sp. TaxID=1926495 RepID=UPI002B466CF3|nr:hypothetical protein [Paraburkholderia sp.]HKR47776.1 hypothetical protein [Paraburkholderia sp.]
MKLYTSDNSELMEVTAINSNGTRLIVTGTIMGAMPVEAILTGTELRKIFALLGIRTILAALRIMFTK